MKTLIVILALLLASCGSDSGNSNSQSQSSSSSSASACQPSLEYNDPPNSPCYPAMEAFILNFNDICMKNTNEVTYCVCLESQLQLLFSEYQLATSVTMDSATAALLKAKSPNVCDYPIPPDAKWP